MKVVVASQNAGKIKEIQALTQAFGLEMLPQTELGVLDIEETGLTFVENALLKARHCCYQTKLPAIADDSGLQVTALHGQPGIFSARYAGLPTNAAANIQKVLMALKDVPQNQRQATFHCSIVYMAHAEDPTPLICEGSWQGSILFEPQGEQGFGYDPIFFVPEEQCSAAQLTLATKNRLSHRGQALRLLLTKLPEKIGH